MVTSSFKNISVYRRNPRAVTFLSFTLATSILSAPMYSISAQAREKLTSAPLWLSIGNFKELFADYDLKLNNIKTIVEKLYRIPICDFTELYTVTGYWISSRITGRIPDMRP